MATVRRGWQALGIVVVVVVVVVAVAAAACVRREKQCDSEMGVMDVVIVVAIAVALAVVETAACLGGRAECCESMAPRVMMGPVRLLCADG